MNISPQDFQTIAQFLYARSGLSLTQEKSYLLESRLVPIMRLHHINDFTMLAERLKLDPTGALAEQVVDAMTTNESMFFRDQKPFDILRQSVFPALRSSKAPHEPIRIWSAACSNGQEPYSIAMAIKEDPAMSGRVCEIYATDIAKDVVEKASDGCYTQFEAQRGLPITHLIKYFDQSDNNQWRVKPILREMITFERLNLVEAFAEKGPFDVIFCRNVLIYFDAAGKERVLQNMASVMTKGATLFLGSSETVKGLDHLYDPHSEHKSIFVRK